MSDESLDSLRPLFIEKSFGRGDIIVYEGEPAEAIYFVVSGAVKEFKTSAEGKEQILKIVRPGDPFNDVPVFDDEPIPSSAEAMGPVVLYELRKDDLKDLLEKHPQIDTNTIRILAGRVRHLVSLVEDLSFRQVIGRVARILLENAGDGTGSGQRLTQQEMAAMAGSAREVVSRSLKSLEDGGVIRLERHKIVITDKDTLRDMVEAPF